jgi:NAD(P)-dependent dehydrogenase (short-subunit alcohol dehydrogenase family)
MSAMQTDASATPTAGDVVVITGGSRGIGAATARLAAAAGWTVCLSYRTRAAEAAAVTQDCERFGVPALAVRADMTSEADIVGLFDAANSLGPLCGAVLNAGIVTPAGPLETMTAKRIRDLLEVNVVAAFLCAREAVRRIPPDDRGGSIVAVSSRAAALGSPGEYVDYAASKAAVDTLAVGLGKELADRRIRVNAVRPGLIDTDIHADNGDPGRLARVAPTVPMGRAGTADEVAAAIVFLLSSAAGYVTSALLDIGGGR